MATDPAPPPATEPTPPSWWSDDAEAECALALVADLTRLQDALDAEPDSPTLTRLAIRHPVTGAVVGMTPSFSPTEAAWSGGAPAALIVQAERLAAFIGKRGDPGYHHRAIRLQHEVRAVNRRLAIWSGIARTLPTLTVLARCLDAALGSLAPALAATRWATGMPTGARGHGPGTGSDPPPLDAADLTSILRTGPPTSPQVRPRKAAPVLEARRSERWTVSRAA